MVAHGLRILNYCLPDGKEEEREGWMDGGGVSKQHIYICVSILDLAIRQEKPTAAENALRASHLLPIFKRRRH